MNSEKDLSFSDLEHQQISQVQIWFDLVTKEHVYWSISENLRLAMTLEFLKLVFKIYSCVEMFICDFGA